MSDCVFISCIYFPCIFVLCKNFFEFHWRTHYSVVAKHAHFKPLCVHAQVNRQQESRGVHQLVWIEWQVRIQKNCYTYVCKFMHFCPKRDYHKKQHTNMFDFYLIPSSQ